MDSTFTNMVKEYNSLSSEGQYGFRVCLSFLINSPLLSQFNGNVDKCIQYFCSLTGDE